MKLALLLALAAPGVYAASTTINVNPGDSVTVVAPASGTTPPPPSIPPPVPPSPPTAGSKPDCASNYTFLDWTAPAPARRGYSGSFAPGGVWVIEFRSPIAATSGSLPRISAAEWNSPPSSRVAVLSTVPCDFSGTALGYGSTSQSNSPNLVFAVGNRPNWYTAAVPIANVIYFNIRNAESPTCGGTGACDMFVDLVVPSVARTTARAKPATAKQK